MVLFTPGNDDKNYELEEQEMKKSKTKLEETKNVTEKKNSKIL